MSNPLNNKKTTKPNAPKTQIVKPILYSIGVGAFVFFGGVVGITLQAMENKNTDPSISSFISTTGTTDTQPATLDAFGPQTELVTITSDQASSIAQQSYPNSSLIGLPELVNLNGSAAYEVKLDTGVAYVDAKLGQLLDPIVHQVSAKGYSSYEEEEDDDDYDDDDEKSEKHKKKDKHHKDKDEHEEKERHSKRDKYNQNIVVANYKQHHDEEEYDD